MSRRFEPKGLPRHRRGTTPGMVGRYPDLDVLESAGHWDEVTRELVLARVNDVPARRFFDEREWGSLNALCDHLSGQVGEEPKLPVLAYIDDRLERGEGVGYRYFDMPDDGTTWRTVARGVDQEADRTGRATFDLLGSHEQDSICHRFAQGALHGGAWATLNVSHAFSIVMRDVCEAYYAHPWAWNEIGFPGPAYPRGYKNPGVDTREPFEVRDARPADDPTRGR